jgi:hypothetical protein
MFPFEANAPTIGLVAVRIVDVFSVCGFIERQVCRVELKEASVGDAKDDKEKFWGWCECDCIHCIAGIGDHHLCPDKVKCGMPKTWDKNEKPRAARAGDGG